MRSGRRTRAAVGLAAVAAVLAVALAAVTAGPDPASAQGSADTPVLPVLFVREIDSSVPADTAVRFVYSGSGPDISDLTLTENGRSVAPSVVGPLPGTTTINVALVFDTSEVADTSGALVNAKAAAKSWIRGRSPEQRDSMRFAVFVASTAGELIQSYTADEQRLLAAIDRVGPPSDPAARTRTALWSAIRQAGNTLDDENGQANLVVMTAQGDNASGGDAAAARGAVSTADAAVFVVAYTGSGRGADVLAGLVQTNGGELLRTADGQEVGGLVESVGATVSDGQYELRYASEVAPGTAADLSLSVGGLHDDSSAVVGGITAGVPTLHLARSTAASGVGALQGDAGLYLGIVAVLVAVAALAYGLVLLFAKDDTLTRTLQPYAESSGGVDDDPVQTQMATSALMQRAVEITEQVASDRGILVRAEAALERANLPLRAGEALFFYGAGVIMVTLFLLFLTRSAVMGLILGILVALLPVATVNLLASQRRKKFLALLPDTLTLLAGTLRAGYSLMQGVEAVSREVEEPMGQELRRVVTEARLGRPLEESLEGTAARMDSPDFGWAVMAIRIQREVGGNLSELLVTVAETMTARERLRRDVASLTAEGRMSAIVLGLLPLGLGLVMWTLNPEYMGQLLHTGLGNIMLGLAVVSMGVGFLWMKKIIDIEI